jgi:aldehyde:ferredoxin oxidoreductase
MEYYLPWCYAREDEPVKTFFDAPTLANDYSLETWELKSMVDWLYSCYHAGSLTEKETGLPLSRIGTREFLEKLLHSIAYREGFGDILAEGLARIGDKVSDKARGLLSYNVAPIGIHDLFPPRIFVVNALLYPMEPRVHHNILHEAAWVVLAWNFNRLEPGATPVTSEVFQKIARTFWGSEEAADVTSYSGKALAAKLIQDRTYIKESLGLCDFAYPITYSFNTPDHVGDPDIEAKIFSAVTGVDSDELVRYAGRICNLQRAILVREGWKVPEADFPPLYNFTESMQAVPNFEMEVVPGPGGEPVLTEGKVLDKDRFKAMLREYYRLRGWNEVTGLPLTETLADLDVKDLKSAF